MNNLYKLSVEARQRLIEEKFSQVNGVETLSSNSNLSNDIGDSLIENFIGYFQFPMGFVKEMPIDGQLYNLIMAVEESSVIAALNKSSKVFRERGTISTKVFDRSISGQIAYINNELNGRCLIFHLDEIRNHLITNFPSFFDRGGRLLDIKKKISKEFTMYEIVINPLEAMGANIVTQMSEFIGRYLSSKYFFPKPLMCILSNSNNNPSVRVEAILEGVDKNIGNRIKLASKLAIEYPERASTHNKGIINAIDPLLIVTGNDWRANGATIHSFAARSGKYGPLSTWDYNDNQLKGVIEIPLQLGIVGGATKVHPLCKICLDIMKISNTLDLSRVVSTAGLLQNYSALNALVGDGIISGHMKMHISNIVYELSDEVSTREILIKELEKELLNNKKISISIGERILNRILKNA